MTKLKLVQITATKGVLYGLDKDGVVWVNLMYTGSKWEQNNMEIKGNY